MIKPELEVPSVEQMGNADWENLFTMLNRFGCAHIRQMAEHTEPISALRLLHEPFGVPIFHKLSDQYGIHPIRYMPGYPEYANVNAEHLDLHTDGSFEPVPPTYMLMYCETPADEGGDSLLASGDRLFKHLSLEHPGYLAALSKPAAFTITRDDRTAKRAVFTPVNGRLRLAFRSGNDIRLEIDSKAVTAFDHVRAWLRDPANCIHYKLGAGDILIFDNTRMLHGRTAFSRESARSLHGLWCNGQSAFRDRLTSGIDPHGVCT
jgi:alpha-ketoglutarate-dependent taurine dioxygenase